MGIIIFMALLFLAAFRFGDGANRTVICLTGRLDTLYLTWNQLNEMMSNNVKRNFQGPTANIIENIFVPLSSGGFDVFMFVQTMGDGSDSEPNVGNTTACRPFLNKDIFNAETGNKFFCSVEQEMKLRSAFMRHSPLWRYFDKRDRPEAIEGHLQQAYGMYRCNQAVHQYVCQQGGSSSGYYTYKIRLRTDIVYAHSLPDIETLAFASNSPKSECEGGSVSILTDGATEDTFAIGRYETMDHFLDHYNSFIYPDKFTEDVSQGPNWNNERHLLRYLAINKVCAIKDALLPYARTARKIGHVGIDDRIVHKDIKLASDWVEL